MGLIGEAVINPNDETLENLKSDLSDHFNSSKNISYGELKNILEKYGVEVVTYKEFISDYPKEYSENIPTKIEVNMAGGFFGMVNPVTNKMRIIVIDEKFSLNIKSINRLIYTLKHENIHYIQASRKGDKKSGEYYGDSKDFEKYFVNKDEIMAFAHTIVERYMEKFNPDSFETAKKNIELFLKYDYMFDTIRKNVDDKTLNRYKKYIYLYLEQEFGL